MYDLMTQISFEAAHRLYDVDTYSEECRNNIHGHSYKVTVYVTSGPTLNSAGMVIDFKQLKEIIRNCIESKYDHSCILVKSDPLCQPIAMHCKKVHIVDENPTAEWMAHHFFEEIDESLKHVHDIWLAQVYRVDVQETENNIAIYRRDDT